MDSVLFLFTAHEKEALVRAGTLWKDSQEQKALYQQVAFRVSERLGIPMKAAVDAIELAKGICLCGTCSGAGFIFLPVAPEAGQP
jgi:hypothetical protein